MNIIGSSLDISNIAGALSDVYVQTPTMGVYIAAILACLLLVLSGFASGSEIAFFSLSPNDLAELDPERNTADRHIQMLRDDSERTLASILITNNFVNVTIIMLCYYVFG
jgi:Mg2+/Co2+ transporter CorB